MALTGVDISHHQNDAGPIDWARLSGSVDFLLAKASERTDYVDAKYAVNVGWARSAGKLTGSYHFAGSSLTGSVGDPVAEAEHYVAAADHRPGELLVLDYEPGHPPADPDGWCAAFIDRVRALTGVTPLIYMSESTARAIPWSATRATGTRLWVARYGPNTGSKPAIALNVGVWGSAVMWQFTSKGSVPGLVGWIDVDEFTGTAGDWLRYGGASGAAAPVTSASAAPAGFDAAGWVRGWRAAAGDAGQVFALLQEWANAAFPAYAHIAPVAAAYGPQTVAFLKEFCRRVGVGGDGRDIGPKTAAALVEQGFAAFLARRGWRP